MSVGSGRSSCPAFAWAIEATPLQTGKVSGSDRSFFEDSYMLSVTITKRPYYAQTLFLHSVEQQNGYKFAGHQQAPHPNN